MMLLRATLVLFALFAGLEDTQVRTVEDLRAKLEIGATARVTDVVDGDTVILDNGQQVRLVGIQAPKLPLGREGFEKWPLADEAKEALERLVLERSVTLAYGGQRVDRYNRQLAHLFTEDGTWVQAAMLDQGLSRVYSFPDNRALVADMLFHERRGGGTETASGAFPIISYSTPTPPPDRSTGLRWSKAGYVRWHVSGAAGFSTSVPTGKPISRS
jgi:micrococcal nuclease